MASGTGVRDEAAFLLTHGAANQGRVIQGQIREQAGQIETQDKHQPEGGLALGGPAWSAMPEGDACKEQRGD